MSERSTYVPYIPDDLIKAVGSDAAILACKLGTFADEKGAIRVSFAYLSEIWGIDKRQLVKAADKLNALQIWHYKKHHGRGLVTEWKKGANYVSFIALKKVQILQIKGAKNVPNNKDYNKDRLISAPARAINRKSLTNAGDTPAPPKSMEQFEQFYTAFFFGAYAKYEKEQAAYKERAAAVWHHLPEEKRERLLSDIKAGKRWDKSHWILWYLQNYEIPRHIWYAGDQTLTPDMIDHLQVVKYKGRLAYIKPEDKDAWIKAGVKMFNN